VKDPWWDALKKVSLRNYDLAARKRNSNKEIQGKKMPVGLPSKLQEQHWRDQMKKLIPFVDANNMRGLPVEDVYKAFIDRTTDGKRRRAPIRTISAFSKDLMLSPHQPSPRTLCPAPILPL